MSAPKPLVHLIEDDLAFRNSLCVLLESWQMNVRQFGDGETYLAADCCNEADCILLDVRLPKIDGLSVLSQLRENKCTTPIIIITGHGDVPMAVRAMQAGASDFLEKPFDSDELIDHIQRYSRHPQLEDQSVTGPLDDPTDTFTALTPRERDVMLQVVAGHANKIIARNLGLSHRTVEIHRSRVMEKTGAQNLSHLVRMALKAGIDPDDGAV